MPRTVPGLGVTSLCNGGFASVALQSGSLDDGGWSNIPIGFSYNFFGNSYSSLNIGTNAVVQFGAYSASDLGDFSYAGLPNEFEPANIIAAMATDMDLRTSGQIQYWTGGIAPTRFFVVNYIAVPGWSTNNGFHTMQLILHETTGIVEVHVTSATRPAAKTIGLQDLTRTIGATAPGRNGFTTLITTPEAWRFSPPANYTYSWTPATNLSATNIQIPTINTSTVTAGTYNYTVTVNNPLTGCAASGPVGVTVNQLPSLGILAGRTTLCDGQNTNLTAVPTPVLTGSTYNWSTSASTQTITVNSANTYGVSYTTAAGCIATASQVIGAGAVTVVTAVTGTNATATLGRATVSVTSGTGPFTYLWSNGATTTSIIAVAGGYRVTVTGAGGCAATANASIFNGTPATNNQPCNFNYFSATTGGVPSSQAGAVSCFSVLGNNIGATSIGDPTDCGSPGDKGVYYYFRMPCGPAGPSNTRIKISTNNPGTSLAGTNLGVYSVTNAGSCVNSSFNLRGCSNSSNIAGCSGISGSGNNGTLEFGPSAPNGPLQSGGNYYIYVSGDNGSEGSFELTFEYVQNGGISVTAGATPGQSEVAVPNNGQSGFRAQWRPLGAIGWASSPLNTGFTYTLPVNSLMPGVSYEYRALYDACLPSGFITMASPVVNFATTATVSTCAPVAGLSCNRVASSVTATWVLIPTGTTGLITVVLRNGSSNLVGRNLATTVTNTVFTSVPTATSMQIQSNCGGAAYIATSNCTLNAASQQSAEPVSFVFNGITYEGIDFNDPNWGLFGAQPEGEFTMSAENGQLVIRDASDVPSGFDFELQPSVATEFTNVVISTQKAVDAQLTLSNMNGSLVSSQILKEVQNGAIVTLETSELAAGLYIVSIRTNEGNVAKKLVVVK